MRGRNPPKNNMIEEAGTQQRTTGYERQEPSKKHGTGARLPIIWCGKVPGNPIKNTIIWRLRNLLKNVVIQEVATQIGARNQAKNSGIKDHWKFSVTIPGLGLTLVWFWVRTENATDTETQEKNKAVLFINGGKK